MSNVDTATPPATTEKPKRNVDYTIEIVDELPERPFKASPLEDSLDKIIAIHNETPEKLKDKDGNAKWIVIGRYDQSTAAGAAANVLGQRHGKNVNVEGWEFTTRRIDEGNKTGLFVKYTPEAVVPGAKEEWARTEKERRAKLEANRAAKKAAEGQASNQDNKGAQAGSGQAPSAPAPSPSPTPAATPAATPNPAQGQPQGQAPKATATAPK